MCVLHLTCVICPIFSLSVIVLSILLMNSSLTGRARECEDAARTKRHSRQACSTKPIGVAMPRCIVVIDFKKNNKRATHSLRKESLYLFCHQLSGSVLFCFTNISLFQSVQTTNLGVSSIEIWAQHNMSVQSSPLSSF